MDMKKYILSFLLISTSTVYAQTTTPVQKNVQANPCEALERVCTNARYKSDDKGKGRALYTDCISLIISGFPPTDVQTHDLKTSDIDNCRYFIKGGTTH